MTHMDYFNLSIKHKALAERLCSPYARTKDWDEFYAEIWDFVAHVYGRRLENLCGMEVRDFLQGELTEYFRANHCDKLRRFLALEDTAEKPQHFFREWFQDHIRAAYGRVKKRDPELAFESDLYSNEEDDDGGPNGLETRMVVQAKPADVKSVGLKELLKGDGRLAFSSLLSLFWGSGKGKKSARELYTVLMFNLLRFSHKKIAALVGHADHIASAGCDRNFWRSVEKHLGEIRGEWGVRTAELHEVSAYSADGNEEEDPIKTLGQTLSSICFDGRDKSEKRRWRLELHMPPKTNKECLIRGAVQDYEGNVPHGKLFVCGAERIFRDNGCFEFPVTEFLASAESSEVYFEWPDGVKVVGVIHVPWVFDKIILTRRLLEKWAEKRMSESNPLELTAELLNDFGFILPLLVLNDSALATLPFSRFGVNYPDRTRIPRKFNETIVLFRTGIAVDQDSPLSQEGFALPLEWRKANVALNVECDTLPRNLVNLSKDVSRKLGKNYGRLFPAFRFFDDRVDFSSPEIFGHDAESVASAFASLAGGLRFAERAYNYRGWIFASAAYDFENNSVKPVCGVAQKIGVAKSFGATSVTFATNQQGIPDHVGVNVRKIHGGNFDQLVDSICYAHLDEIEPLEPVCFKTVDEQYEEQRFNLYSKLSIASNAKQDASRDRGPFVVLFGKPGMGKSVLMTQLFTYLRKSEHNRCFGYVCVAGREHQGSDFAKSIVYGIGCRCAGCLPDLDGADFKHRTLAGDELKSFYRNWVISSLDRYHQDKSCRGQIYILVDGLDEDSSGEILDLLTDDSLKLPKCVSVIVSSRRIIQESDRISRISSYELDLDSEDPAIGRECYVDVGAYIFRWATGNRKVYNKLRDVGISSSKLRDIIWKQDKSFLYAHYVLNGIGEGHYAIASLGTDLPKDLKGCFYDSFKARFKTANDYEKVKPLLKVMIPTGRICIDESRRLLAGDVNIGLIVQTLRGYVVDEGDELAISSKPLWDWLKDDLHNPEFAIRQ